MEEFENNNIEKIEAETESQDLQVTPSEESDASLLDVDIESSDFEIAARKPIYVFYQSRKQVRQLSKFGDIVYVSEKHNFACLYIEADDARRKISELRRLPFVKRVKEGYLQELAENFNTAFEKTNEEVSAEIKSRQEEWLNRPVAQPKASASEKTNGQQAKSRGNRRYGRRNNRRNNNQNRDVRSGESSEKRA